MTDSWMFPIDLTTMTSVMKMAPWQNLVSPSRWRLHGSFAAQMKGTIQGHLFRTKQAWMIHSRYFKTIFDHFETFMLGNAFGLVGSLSCFNSRIFQQRRPRLQSIFAPVVIGRWRAVSWTLTVWQTLKRWRWDEKPRFYLVAPWLLYGSLKAMQRGTPFSLCCNSINLLLLDDQKNQTSHVDWEVLHFSNPGM